MDTIPPNFTPETLAERWNCTDAHIRNLCGKDKIPNFRLGRLYRIPSEVVLEIEKCGNLNCIEERGAQSEPSTEKPKEYPLEQKIVRLPNSL